jgi:hypothetical protein
MPSNSHGDKQATFIDDHNHQLYAYCKCRDKDASDGTGPSTKSKFENLLSTEYYDKYTEVEILTKNSDSERVEQKEEMNEIFSIYNMVSGYVDDANRSVMSCYYHHRTFHYQTCIQIFLLSVIAHNVRILYNQKTNQKLSQVEFLRVLANELVEITPPHEHKLVQNYDMVNNKPIRHTCSCCITRTGSADKKSKTRAYCLGCEKYLCETCYDSFSHAIYAKTIGRPV